MIDFVVEIFVPVLGSDGKAGSIATGYPVTPNLILTARHSLFPQRPKRDETRPIEIRWRHPDVPKKDWQPTGGIVWESERWDLALFEFEPPPGISIGCAVLSEQRPSPNMEWSSIGFPRVRKKSDGIRDPFPMAGRVFQMMSKDERFDVASEAGPKTKDDWKGASGSPVIVDFRILGMVVSVPDRLGAQRLKAAPMWRVLDEEPEFVSKLGLRERKERRNQLARQIGTVLKDSPGALKSLQVCFAQEFRLSSGDGFADIAAFVERVMNAKLEGLVRACNRAMEELRSAPERMAISRLVQLVVPVIFGAADVDSVVAARGGAGAALLALNAFHPTVAEIIMAGADGRATDYCPRDDEGHFPKGRLNLPEPPENGFDEEGRKAQRALEKHLQAKFRWDEAERFLMDVDAFMIRRFPGGVPAGASEKRRVDSAAREIESQAAHKGRTYYLIVQPPDDKDVEGKARMDATLQGLRVRYPGLMCLALDNTGALDDVQSRQLRSFVDLLPMKSKPQ